MIFNYGSCLRYHNNPAEEAIRPSAVVRKFSYGSKTKKGADNKIMATVMATCKMHGVSFYEYLKAALEGARQRGASHDGNLRTADIGAHTPQTEPA